MKRPRRPRQLALRLPAEAPIATSAEPQRRTCARCGGVNGTLYPTCQSCRWHRRPRREPAPPIVDDPMPF